MYFISNEIFIKGSVLFFKINHFLKQILFFQGNLNVIKCHCCFFHVLTFEDEFTLPKWNILSKCCYSILERIFHLGRVCWSWKKWNNLSGPLHPPKLMSICVNLIVSIYFFVNLLHSPGVWLFGNWHLFDTFNLNHLSPSQGYFCLYARKHLLMPKFGTFMNLAQEL